MRNHLRTPRPWALALASGGALALGACAASQDGGPVARANPQAAPASAPGSATAVPGGTVRWGDSIASMAEQPHGCTAGAFSHA